ncbi:MAG: threonine synthase, partial [Sutterella sp.]
MLYHSTRSTDHAVDARTAIVQGLSDDGGLFVSDALGEKKIDLATLANESYSSLAVRVLSILLDDFSTDELTGAVERAYRGKFATEEITPVTPLGRDWLLELYHGPTSAFKDLALCLLPQLMSLGLKDKKDKVMIATATSGDTGKAALAGFQDVKDIGIAVFYPEGKVSDIQRLQMVTQAGENVAVASVTGNFDDVQSAVKELFQKGSPRADVRLSSANSINIGRLAPQVVYYFDAYRQLLLKGAIQLGDEVDFAAPTGNFGDVLAGYFAKLMGLPVRRLVVASNANHVLTDFLLTGVYDRRRNFEKTISPSMDILISSNLERLLYYVSGKNTEQVAAFM